MKIKNVVFDIGNVLVKWSPYEVLEQLFPQKGAKELYQQIRPIWIDLNLGKLTEQEAILGYQDLLNVPEKQLAELMQLLKTSQTLLPGSLELLKKLHACNVPLYSITDNVKEIMEYHRLNSNFLHYFSGIAVSAEIGILKPNEKIYRYLLEQYKLDPAESVFIDDLMANVEGARAVGMHAFQFISAESCESELIEFGIL